MTLLQDIAPYIPPVRPTTTGEDVYRRLEDEPDTLVICVVDDGGGPVGVLERNSFLTRMAAQHGYALWARRPISMVMKTDFLVVDGAVTVADFCGDVLKERPSDLLHGFVVTRHGRYAGVGAMLHLLQASATAAEEASRRAQAALDARGRFLAVMSHEIRTPLNGVLAVAEILRRRCSQDELRPFIHTIVESGGVLQRLLNDALDLTRAETVGLELDERPVRLGALLDDAHNLWSPRAELRGIELRIDRRAPDDMWVRADGIRLAQVLNNLLSNALKFSPDAAVELGLAATPQAGGSINVQISVADRGPGVPADRRQAIFAPFHQTEEGIRVGGAGLGLAVCRQLAERMGGVIEARENPGGGALFVFEAPFDSCPAPDAEAATDTAETVATAAHLLIVDDNETNLMVARHLCEIFGCSIECADNGATAVQLAASGRFDLILMDVQMPGMDGVQATRAIRGLRSSASQTPIIALTANADPADVSFYRSSGMNGVVAKPINPTQLLHAMNAVLAPQVESEAAA